MQLQKSNNLFKIAEMQTFNMVKTYILYKMQNGNIVIISHKRWRDKKKCIIRFF